MPKIAEIENTPNPNAVKFVLKEPVALGFQRHYPTADIAQADPLARALFGVVGVSSVMMMDRWLTVTKEADAVWNELLPRLAPLIRVAPSASEQADAQPEGEPAETDSIGDDPFLQKAHAALKEHIFPFLAADGGGLRIVGRSGKQVMIRYMGACQNCPAGLTGTLMAIEGVLRAEVDPEITVITV